MTKKITDAQIRAREQLFDNASRGKSGKVQAEELVEETEVFGLNKNKLQVFFPPALPAFLTCSVSERVAALSLQAIL